MRERFIEGLLSTSIADTRFYHAVFNSSKSNSLGIARSIMGLVFEKGSVGRDESQRIIGGDSPPNLDLRSPSIPK